MAWREREDGSWEDDGEDEEEQEEQPEADEESGFSDEGTIAYNDGDSDEGSSDGDSGFSDGGTQDFSYEADRESRVDDYRPPRLYDEDRGRDRFDRGRGEDPYEEMRREDEARRWREEQDRIRREEEERRRREEEERRRKEEEERRRAEAYRRYREVQAALERGEDPALLERVPLEGELPPVTTPDIGQGEQEETRPPLEVPVQPQADEVSGFSDEPAPAPPSAPKPVFTPGTPVTDEEAKAATDAAEQPKPNLSPEVVNATVGTTHALIDSLTKPPEPDKPSPADTIADPSGTTRAVAPGATTASDGQHLDQQSAWTKSIFRGEYGENAAAEWVRQHEAELERNQRLYGSREPAANTAAVAGAPAGTPVAPQRKIDAVRPPGPGETAQYGSMPRAVTPPAPAAPAAPASPAAPAAPTAPTAPSDRGAPRGGNAADTGVTPAAGAVTPISDLEGSQIAPPPVQTPMGSVVNADITDVVLAGTALRDPAWAASIKDPAFKENVTKKLMQLFSSPNPQDQTIAASYLTAVAQVAWYREETANGRQPETPEMAPGPYVNDWIDKFQNGQASAIPLGARLEQRIVQHGFKPPSQQKPTTAPIKPGERKSNIETTSPTAVATGTAPSEAPTSITTPGQPQVNPATGEPTGLADPVIAATDSTTPVNSLLGLQNQQSGQGKTPEQIAQESKHLLQGIGAVIRGDKAGQWTEPYVNDVARLAWSKEERAAGRAADPRNTPVEYIEKWKDAFYGDVTTPGNSDPDPPMVRELRQQLIDEQVELQGGKGPFNWRNVYGQNGEKGLIPTQTTSNDCGPTAFTTVLRANGVNAEPGGMFTLAKDKKYWAGGQFQGPYAMQNMLRTEAGLDSKVHDGVNYEVIDKELAEGRVVLLSGPTHWWAVSGKDDQGRYYAGQTGVVVGNGKDGWVPKGGFFYGGSGATHMVTYSGELKLNPDTATKYSLTSAGGGGSANNRALLSSQTKYQTPGQQAGTQVTMSMKGEQPQQTAPDGGAIPPPASGSPTPKANLKPVYTEAEVREMQDRIINEMPQIKFDPGDDVPTRMRKMQPALEWFEREYGYPAEMTAGLMMAENGAGTADTPAVRGNNLFSLQWNQQHDRFATGYAPGQSRWAAYPTINHAFARKVGIFAHPDNKNYNQLWEVRNSKDPDKLLDAMVKGGYIVEEPGFPISTWRANVKKGIEEYRRSTQSTRRTN